MPSLSAGRTDEEGQVLEDCLRILYTRVVTLGWLRNRQACVLTNNQQNRQNQVLGSLLPPEGGGAIYERKEPLHALVCGLLRQGRGSPQRWDEEESFLEKSV
jgi:hypothetical protein